MTAASVAASESVSDAADFRKKRRAAASAPKVRGPNSMTFR
jgi:hypothetical protein